MAVRFEVEAGIATITLDRPERRNALTEEMRIELIHHLQRCANDESVRVVILCGTGGAFCSGADVSTMNGKGIPEGRSRLRVAHQIVAGIAYLEKPVIAMVDGVAAGIGWSLCLAADFIFASPNASFGQVFRKVGLAPDGGSVWLLSRYVGILRAKELTMTARIINADEAFRLGLITEVVQGNDLSGRVNALAKDLAGAANLALGMTKQLFHASGATDFKQFLDIESHVQNELLQTDDHAEGVAAFIEKRKPYFSGR